MSLAAVLFDLDDTLVDSLPMRSAALQSVFDSTGLGDLSAPSFFAAMGGRAMDESLRDLAEQRGIAGDLFGAYADRYWAKPSGSLSLFPGVREMLSDLGGRFELGLVTNKTRRFERDGATAGAAAELAELGLDDAFSVVVGYEDAGLAKPDPSGLILAMKRLGVAPSEALYVGDSAADMAAAAAAGCVGGHALWGAVGPPMSADVTFDAPQQVVGFARGETQAGPINARAK